MRRAIYHALVSQELQKVLWAPQLSKPAWTKMRSKDTISTRQLEALKGRGGFQAFSAAITLPETAGQA